MCHQDERTARRLVSAGVPRTRARGPDRRKVLNMPAACCLAASSVRLAVNLADGGLWGTLRRSLVASWNGRGMSRIMGAITMQMQS